ncbi:hypothetical protein BGW36DRAFT_41428 [Talaromyces proteolyticus]|uniref:Uncharacterized protein n=1 Tax=Talaromyces proteolyticus TaxID=1131652 RepID=A0AAD4PWW4_9EURO|nr:uncharacterized protein BGW36DRAFT_41428 [Talaromyces proteolyticus]KAH8692084.1 hypothetical protein BGW36DRAFT_41428 [Talaromyces proteolyticus]
MYIYTCLLAKASTLLPSLSAVCLLTFGFISLSPHLLSTNVFYRTKSHPSISLKFLNNFFRFLYHPCSLSGECWGVQFGEYICWPIHPSTKTYLLCGINQINDRLIYRVVEDGNKRCWIGVLGHHNGES